jgi:uncharacterized protein
MSQDVGSKAVDMFLYLAEGAKSADITFTGGEPLTEFSFLKEMIQYAQTRAMAVGIKANFVLKTNGTILDEKVLDLIRAYGIKTVVSIDGTPPVHDKHRKTAHGKRTHSLVRNNLSALLENNVPCVASITVHPDACAFVLESVRYLHQLGVEQLDVGPVYGVVQWTDEDCRNLAQSLMDVASYMRDVLNQGKRLEVGPLYRDSEHVGGILLDCWGCHAASANLAFLPNGQVTGCSALAMLIHRIPGLILGDVFDGLDQAAIDELVQQAQAPAEKRFQCKCCAFSLNCAGGCLAINYATTASALVPPQVYCDTISAIPKAWRNAWQG